jgi:acetaldehyde dehydrogenase
MRDTVFVLSADAEEKDIRASIEAMVAEVQKYVPGYRLKQDVQFEHFGSNNPITIPGLGRYQGLKTSVFIEVEGAAHYLPAYAGNLDIMTSAALATGEKIARRILEKGQKA